MQVLAQQLLHDEVCSCFEKHGCSQSIPERVLVASLHLELSVTRGDAWLVVPAQLEEGDGLLVPHAAWKWGPW